ncbi:hypothetical protein D9M71_225360 [compost metagenome]
MYQYHKWLRSFHAVARIGSFTAAAEYLSVNCCRVFASERKACYASVRYRRRLP